MGLLVNSKEKTLTHQESQKFQRFLKKVAALQLTKLFKVFAKHANGEANRLKFGIEQELHLMTPFSLKQPKAKENCGSLFPGPRKEFSVSVAKEEFLKQIPNELKNELEFTTEYGAWMVEVVPMKPFEGFLNAKEIWKHLGHVESINRLGIKVGLEEGKTKKHFLLSATVVPKLGHADYYIRPNGERVHWKERAKINDLSGSKYFIDETVVKHSRYETFTKNTLLKRGVPVETNIPIFVDSETKMILKELYKETDCYGDIPFEMEKKVREEFREKGVMVEKGIYERLLRENRSFISSNFREKNPNKKIICKSPVKRDFGCNEHLFKFINFDRSSKHFSEESPSFQKIFTENVTSTNLKKEEISKSFNLKKLPHPSQKFFNKNYITLDSFGFGLSNACLQITYSSRNMTEARKIYDSFGVLSSVMTALCASTAVVDSTLIDWDSRLRIIEQSTDTRSEREHVIA